MSLPLVEAISSCVLLFCCGEQMVRISWGGGGGCAASGIGMEVNRKVPATNGLEEKLLSLH
jgi:hypothetical protein